MGHYWEGCDDYHENDAVIFADVQSRLVLVVVVTVLYSSMDGLKVSSRIKTALGVAFASYVSVFAWYYTLSPEADECLVSVVGVDVDMQDFVTSSNRVLS